MKINGRFYIIFYTNSEILHVFYMTAHLNLDYPHFKGSVATCGQVATILDITYLEIQ